MMVIKLKIANVNQFVIVIVLAVLDQISVESVKMDIIQSMVFVLAVTLTTVRLVTVLIIVTYVKLDMKK